LLIPPVIVALLTIMPVTVPLIKPLLLIEPAVPNTIIAGLAGVVAIEPVPVTTSDAPPVNVQVVG